MISRKKTHLFDESWLTDASVAFLLCMLYFPLTLVLMVLNWGCYYKNSYGRYVCLSIHFQPLGEDSISRFLFRRNFDVFIKGGTISAQIIFDIKPQPKQHAVILRISCLIWNCVFQLYLVQFKSNCAILIWCTRNTDIIIL